MERGKETERLAEIGAEPLKESGFEDELADSFDAESQDTEGDAR